MLEFCSKELDTSLQNYAGNGMLQDVYKAYLLTRDK
jgi:hypothetical protein